MKPDVGCRIVRGYIVSGFRPLTSDSDIPYFKEGCRMNWDQISGSWTSAKGKIKEQWGKLTDDDLDIIAGKRDQLLGRLQQRYGYSKEQAENEVDRWERSA